ncbi:MAG: universal stress protein [Dehalococcoidia bacterium]|nr:universal stress protein [Dehalococcoidia bacterium]
MVSYLLVPVDGSPEAEATIPVAAAIAARLRAGLRLLRVVRYDFECAAAEKEMDDLVARHGATSGSVVVSGNVFRTILNHLDEDPGGLVAMSTHGRSRLFEEVMGSTALTLVRMLSRPVIVYRPTGHEAAPESRMPIETIVVPVDGSDFAESMIPVAAEFAKAIGAGIELIQVIPSVDRPGSGDVIESSYVRGHAEALQRDAGVPVSFETLHGDPAKVIPEYVRTRPGAMLAMTTHARRGIERIAFGGVANACIRHSGVPILLRHPGSHAPES